MLHLDEGTIHAWLDGELSPDDAERAARHAAECAECGALVAETRGMIAGATRIVSSLDTGPVGVVPRTQRAASTARRRWYRLALTPARMSIAATIIVAVGVTLTVRRVNTDGDLTRSVKVPDDSLSSPRAVEPLPPPASPASLPASSTPAPPPPSSTLASAPAAAPAQVDRTTASAEKTEQKAGLDTAREVAKDEAPKVAAATSMRDATANGGVVSEDCYHLDVDSTDWHGVLPSAFALGGASAEASAAGVAGGGGAAQSAGAAMVPGVARPMNRALALAEPESPVHAVTSGGRVDSLVVGVWRRAGPQLVSVHLAADDRHKPVTLLLTSTGSTARVISSDRTDSVRVVRSTCPR